MIGEDRQVPLLLERRRRRVRQQAPVADEHLGGLAQGLALRGEQAEQVEGAQRRAGGDVQPERGIAGGVERELVQAIVQVRIIWVDGSSRSSRSSPAAARNGSTSTPARRTSSTSARTRVTETLIAASRDARRRGHRTVSRAPVRDHRVMRYRTRSSTSSLDAAHQGWARPAGRWHGRAELPGRTRGASSGSPSSSARCPRAPA